MRSEESRKFSKEWYMHWRRRTRGVLEGSESACAKPKGVRIEGSMAAVSFRATNVPAGIVAVVYHDKIRIQVVVGMQHRKAKVMVHLMLGE